MPEELTTIVYGHDERERNLGLRKLPWRTGGRQGLMILDADGNPLGSTSSAATAEVIVKSVNAVGGWYADKLAAEPAANPAGTTENAG